MRVVVDTNVFVSGVFFGGVPGSILRAWREARIELVVSLEILEEYRRVGDTLSEKYEDVDLDPFLALLATHAKVVDTPPLAKPVSVDPDDDKFLACALAGDATIVVSGDKDLVDHSGWRGVQVLRPRQFSDEFLSSP